MSELATVPVTALKGVGAALAEKLARVGLETLQDVLFHLPLRYQDRTRVVPIGALRPGQDAVIEGVVSGADIVMGRRRSLLVRLQDGSGTLSLRFYHFSQAQKEAMKRGTQLRCYGEARPGASGLEIYHPEYRALTGEPAPVEQTLTPIYPTTEGLTQQRLRNLSEQALARLGPSWRATTSSVRWIRRCAICTGRRPTPIWKNSPKAGTGRSIAWHSRSC